VNLEQSVRYTRAAGSIGPWGLDIRKVCVCGGGGGRGRKLKVHGFGGPTCCMVLAASVSV
jgi:hypothetical protein